LRTISEDAGLDARDAGRLAERLNEVLASGHTAQWAQDRKADLDALPDETCPLCGGSGERHDEYIDGPCNSCAGRGRDGVVSSESIEHPRRLWLVEEDDRAGFRVREVDVVPVHPERGPHRYAHYHVAGKEDWYLVDLDVDAYRTRVEALERAIDMADVRRLRRGFRRTKPISRGAGGEGGQTRRPAALLDCLRWTV
jgi:hypothetical protein